ncbi:MAG: site-specific integrase, partial [Prolixibacteraceae bacterium]|nr:site-specific integrase [Prolixibacteraceae bacterium]
REKKNGNYPVKLRVYSPLIQKVRNYSTGMDMTKKEFESVWETIKPRKEKKDIRDFLEALKTKATEAANKCDPFSFELFDKKLHRRKGDGKNVIYHYNQRIQYFTELKRFGTAETYDLSLKSILKYIEDTKGTKPTKLPFNNITSSFLQKYENFMLEKGKSETTVSMYVRSLRAVFNHAIRENEVSEDIYPFGKNKYEIPAGNAVKKALSKSQLKVLFNATPAIPEQEKAKDFWFFSFVCNGMNINDIAMLKYKNIKGNTIEFKRAKTRQTAKKKSTTIVVHLTDFSKQIIEKYGNEDKNPENYIFSIIDSNTKPEEMKPRIKNFTRLVNQHIKNLAKANELPEDISSYYARHTFATLSIQGGASMEFVQESLGHQNISTTQNYFSGFEDETKKQIVESLLNFD